MICLSGSAAYHLFGTANTNWTTALGTLDYVGITALIVGSFVPVLYYGFYEHVVYRRMYITSICALGTIILGLSVTPFFHDARYRVARTLTFVALGFTGFFPLLHLVVQHGLNELSMSVLIGCAVTGASYLMGTVFYISRFPESVAPGRFDFIMSSHNIWHLFVVLGGYVHYSFVMELWSERSGENLMVATVAVQSS